MVDPVLLGHDTVYINLTASLSEAAISTHCTAPLDSVLRYSSTKSPSVIPRTAP